MTDLDELIQTVPKKDGDKIYSRFGIFKRKGRVDVVVHCEEHEQDEYVEQIAYHTDLGWWYAAGMHPRFSIVGAFKKAGQTRNEIGFHVGISSLGNRRSNDSDLRAAKAKFIVILSESKTEKDFLKMFQPSLFTDLVTPDRTHRVTMAFKEKYETKSFRPDDFFNEQSQELRRLVVRGGCPIKEVLKRMKFISKDEEGELYDMPPEPATEESERQPFVRPIRIRYLYVTCPSTGQEYLLGVPDRFSKPKEARRWTFNLPPEAEFVKEA